MAAAPAQAAIPQHPFLGAFCEGEPTGIGTPPCEPPKFGTPEGMAVDQSTGDLLVIDASDNTLSRWHHDGTPAEFSALGSNVIDGHPGGPDATPSEEILGEFNSPYETQVAVDNSGTSTDGDIYVTNYSNREIDIFASDGEYIGGLTEFTTGSGTEAFGEPCGVAVDEHGDVYVGDDPNGVLKFANPPVDGASELTIAAAEPCAVAAGSGSVFATTFFGAVTKFNAESGEEEYVVSPGENTTVSVDPASGHVFAVNAENLLEYHAAATKASGATAAMLVSSTALDEVGTGVAVSGATGEVYASRQGSENVEVYGPSVYGAPEFQFKVTKSGNRTGSVECEVEDGPAAPCPQASTLYPEGTEIKITATATGSNSEFAGFSGGGCSVSPSCTLTLEANTTVTATFSQIPPSVENNPEGAVTATTAVLNAHVDNEGDPAGSACSFEVAAATDTTFSSPVATPGCVPNPVTGSTNNAVTATVTGLNPATAYIYRVKAVNSSPTPSFGAPPEPFATPAGRPLVTAEFASSVAVTTATLNAEVDPAGLATTYHFEYLDDADFQSGGFSSPATIVTTESASIGEGNTPVAVQQPIERLQPNTTYHFRVVATNSAGKTEGADRQFTTFEERQALNSAGLPDNRGFELVSPADKRPQGAVRGQIVLMNIFQAAEDGQSVIFPLLGGAPGADSGGDASYLARRSPSGWQSTKVSPPSLLPNPRNGLIGVASAGFVTQYSPDLSCGVVYTFNPLTDDTPVADVELGIYNLYVRHGDGTYTLITGTVPSNPEISPFLSGDIPITTVAGISQDCSRVYFKTRYKYLPSPSGVYEWDNGVLRDAGQLPNGATASGKVGAGDFLGSGNQLNSVSRDGSRFFFSAVSNEEETEGTQAVFVREDPGGTADPACVPSPTSPSCTVEASRSQGGAHDSLGARYELASANGSHVFFLASYGLTPASSNGPTESCSDAESGTLRACDLYDYDVDTGQLRDLSADTNAADAKGPVVQGVISASDDGSSVYFAARGQLTPGEGKTYAQNISGPGSANLYLARGGELSYVATIAAQDLTATLIRGATRADVTPDGEHLLFESAANITGYDSGGVREAYLYSAETDTIACVSCRPDGQPSVGDPATETSGTRPLIASFHRIPPQSTTHMYKMSNDGSRVFFTMPDSLATGAVSGNQNIYEWERGQVYLILTGAPELITEGLPTAQNTLLYGVSRSGDDVFVRTTEQLTAQDFDFALDLYDVRVDGGFPVPSSREPCDPTGRDDCQGTPTPPPGASSPASEGFSGPGNPPVRRPCPRGKVRRHGKCLKKHRKRRHAHRWRPAARRSDGASKSDSSRGSEAGALIATNHGGAK